MDYRGRQEKEAKPSISLASHFKGLLTQPVTFTQHCVPTGGCVEVSLLPCPLQRKCSQALTGDKGSLQVATEGHPAAPWALQRWRLLGWAAAQAAWEEIANTVDALGYGDLEESTAFLMLFFHPEGSYIKNGIIEKMGKGTCVYFTLMYFFWIFRGGR